MNTAAEQLKVIFVFRIFSSVQEIHCCNFFLYPNCMEYFLLGSSWPFNAA